MITYLGKEGTKTDMSMKCMLTTFDNPYDPFDDYTGWLVCDIERGHGCCEMLGRFARTSDVLSPEENDREVERAIDEIIKHDFLNIYKKVKRTY